VKLNQKRSDEDIELRKMELNRVCERDKLHDEHEESLSSQTNRYGDMLKRVLPNMPSDPADLVSWLDNCRGVYPPRASIPPNNHDATLPLFDWKL